MLQKVNDKTMLTDNTYTLSKNLVQVWIPAASSLYFGLSAIWGLPYTEQIVGTLALVATFLGIVLKVSGSNYNAADAGYDGQINVDKDDSGNLTYSLEINDDPADIQNKTSVAFKVNPAGVAAVPPGGNIPPSQ